MIMFTRANNDDGENLIKNWLSCDYVIQTIQIYHNAFAVFTSRMCQSHTHDIWQTRASVAQTRRTLVSQQNNR